MNRKKLIGTIAVVSAIAVLIVSGTYAFWYWQSDAGNQTAINFVISRPGFTITGSNVSSSSLVPTTNCAHSTYAMMGNATVTATNDTSATMRAIITLKGRLLSQSGRILTYDNKEHIHWAIKEVESANINTYATANCSATWTANSASYSTGVFDIINGSYTDIATTITFDVNPNGSATKYYQIYAWIDSTYEYTTTGGTATDPMQGLTVNLTFSKSSIFSQINPNPAYYYAFGDPTTSSPIDYNEIYQNGSGHRVFIRVSENNISNPNNIIKEVCIVRNGTLGCFQNGISTWQQTGNDIQLFFSDISCRTNDTITNCIDGGASHCYILSDGYVSCTDSYKEEECLVDDKGNFDCYHWYE